MSQWKEISFKDFKGMVTNVPIRNTNNMKRLLNVDIDEKPGKIVLRKGYERLYDKPVINDDDETYHSLITEPYLEDAIELSGFMTFDKFYDRSAADDAQQVTVLIEKATINSIVAGSSEYVDTMLIFIRPYWNGLVWVDEWDWLNATIVTELAYGSHVTYPNMVRIKAFQRLDRLGTDMLNGWTIYNKTKDQYAQIIRSFNDAPHVKLNTTLYNQSWDNNDTVILYKKFRSRCKYGCK